MPVKVGLKLYCHQEDAQHVHHILILKDKLRGQIEDNLQLMVLQVAEYQQPLRLLLLQLDHHQIFLIQL